MKEEEKPFIQLQQHLDNQAVGFPATRRRHEVRLLKLLFKPGQAKMALNLSFRYDNLTTILDRIREAANTSITREELEQFLDQMERDRLIMRRMRNNEKQYALVPLVVGLYEFQCDRLTTDFIAAMDGYTSKLKYGLSFIGTEHSQMRTIPVEQSITPEHHVMSYDDLKSIILNSRGPFVVVPCICKSKYRLLGNPCKVTKRLEVCLAMEDVAQMCIDGGVGRKISKEETLELERQNEEDGLVLQPQNAQEPQFICACCGDCCGILHTMQDIRRPTDFFQSDFYSTVDPSLCKGCGLCVKRCQVNAVKLVDVPGDTAKKIATVNLTRCIGCGLCVVKCAKKAITLRKKDNPLSIPKTEDELFAEIKRKRKSNWQLWKMGIRMIRGKKWH